MDEKLIYDIGVHDGHDSEFYLKKGFKVIGVEANPKLAEKLKIKLKSYIENDQFILVEKAISYVSGDEISFFINDDKDDWGTTSPKWNRSMDNRFVEIKVETINIEDMVDLYGMPYYMKIDIEGSDVLCLNSLINIGSKPENLSIELLTFNNLVNEDVDHLEILRKLKELGYTNYKISDQSKNHVVDCPYPPLEGSYIDYRFNGLCSGLFGKELINGSISYDKLLNQYNEYFTEKKSNGVFQHSGWYDVHVN